VFDGFLYPKTFGAEKEELTRDWRFHKKRLYDLYL
jgi:hypothetical protein